MERTTDKIEKKLKDNKDNQNIIQDLKKKQQVLTQNKIVKK